jgi:hypothetical protein
MAMRKVAEGRLGSHPNTAPSGLPLPLRAGESRGEGVLAFTARSFLSRRALLSPALSSLEGRRGSSSFMIRGQWPDAPGGWGRRDGALRRPRRVAAAQSDDVVQPVDWLSRARLFRPLCAGGAIAARWPYRNSSAALPLAPLLAMGPREPQRSQSTNSRD